MRCSKCGTNNPSANNFCAKCGNALAKQCLNCKAENPPTSDFCGKCGAPLTNGAGTAAVTSSSPGLASGLHVAPEQTFTDAGALEGERKTVTALFTDIKGSMDMMEDLDPEEARRRPVYMASRICRGFLFCSSDSERYNTALASALITLGGKVLCVDGWMIGHRKSSLH